MGVPSSYDRLSHLNSNYNNNTKGNEMTQQVAVKGQVVVAQVQKSAMSLYGVNTEWAVRLYFSSPTGDSSDSLTFDLPCLSFSQACGIADHYNAVCAPAFVGHFAEMMMNEGQI